MIWASYELRDGQEHLVATAAFLDELSVVDATAIYRLEDGAVPRVLPRRLEHRALLLLADRLPFEFSIGDIYALFVGSGMGRSDHSRTQFERAMLDSEMLVPTGRRRRTGRRGHPARLYRLQVPDDLGVHFDRRRRAVTAA